MTLPLRLPGATALAACIALSSAASAQRLDPGPQVLTIFSDIDDTEQPYALYLPPAYDPARAYPLVISLHGAGSNHRLNLRRVFGKSNAEGETDVEASRSFPEWEDVDYIVASPYARGTMGYQGVAEQDVMDVLADVKRRFSIDENRVYLTGLSMGGGGTMWLGLTRPDIWAAIAPVCPAPPSGTDVFASNALHVPIHVFQGGADPVVSPQATRAWVDRLRDTEASVEYTEYPGVGHDSWVNAYADGQIFQWFAQFRRNPYPDRVRFASDRYAYDSAYWVRLDALLPGRPASIDAQFTADNALEVTTDGLDGLTLALADHPRVTGRRVTVTIDGTALEVAAGDSVSFSRLDGAWTEAAYARVPDAKRPGREGPMADVFAGRHVYVYGTAGDPSPDELTARREQAEHAADWSTYRGWFMGRIMVFPRVMADREVRPSDRADANLVLFGTPGTNTLIAEFADRLPMHLTPDATGDVGLAYVFPLDSTYVLVNEGRAWWDTGRTAGGAAIFAGQVPALQLTGRHDYWLFDAAGGYTVTEGRFDRRWRLPGRQAAQLTGSGVVVVHESAIGGDAEVDLDALLAAMTLDEKLAFLYGTNDPENRGQAGYIPGVPRLGVPPLRLTDGPAGIRTSLPATALPAPVALAASFDPDLARRFGEVIGREGRARVQDVLLSPMVNIVRVPEAGRNFETFGEDPLLAGRMVAEEVRGIEGERLVATVKHYVANNYERDRRTSSAEVDARTLSEIYLPGFEAAVDAGVGSVMCAYNRVNGVYACDHDELLNDVLRARFGFEGWVMTDWWANHTLGSLERGLDQEMPGGGGFRGGAPFTTQLQDSVVAGSVPLEAVDRAVRRILGQMDRMGLLDGSAGLRPAMEPEAGRAVAREVAIAGAVLLKNERAALPISATDLSSVVVIGPTARIPLVGGGGSSRVMPLRTVSLMEALQRRAGEGVHVRHVAGIDLDGVPVPTSALRPDGDVGGTGLTRTGPAGPPQVDAVLDFTGDDALPPGSEWTWSGTLVAPETGDYEIKLQAQGGTATLSLDGEQVLSSGTFFGNASLLATADGLQNATATVRLEAGAPRSMSVTTRGPQFAFMMGGGAPMQVRLAWVTPARRAAFIEEAVTAARSARAAVVIGYDEGTEGRDRPSLALPGAQDELIAAVAEANRRTVVLLQTGSVVLMPWLERAAAALQMWYPGQEGGEAAAAVLLGEANPGGKLPVTFPRAESDVPTAPEARYPGIDGRALYDEGIYVGYRWYDERGIEPLFPFGHGLSYTTFEYGGLEVERAGDGLDVTFAVRNTGSVAGDAVPQVYLGPPSDAAVPMAPRQLVGFERITLEPGQRQRVTVHVGARQLSYWSAETNAWVRAGGERTVSVGPSSRDMPLEAVIEVSR